MQAITANRYGTPDVFALTTVERPELAADAIRIAVAATAATQGDRRLRAADFPGIGWLPGRLVSGIFAPRTPVPGSLFAGTVIERGADVTDFAVGDRVFGESFRGAYAEELVVASSSAVAHAPDGVSFEDAAILGYGPLTAWMFLSEIADVQRGERVVVLGATGGVGRYAVQVARHLGAHVIGVSRRPAAAALPGVSEWMTPDAAAELRDVDVVFDTSGQATFGAWKDRLNETGRFVTTDLSVNVLIAMLRTSGGKGRVARFNVAECTKPRLEAVAALLAEGAIEPVTAATFDLAEAADAHRFLEAERPIGDVRISVRPPLALVDAAE